MHNNFSKEEKLKSRKVIGAIFSDGFVVKSFPIRIQFLFHDTPETPICQLGVSVPKRNFKRAVDRNRIKRQIREAFRLNKHDFYTKLEDRNKKVSMMIIFIGREKSSYQTIEEALTKGLSLIRM